MEEFWNALLRGLTPESNKEINDVLKGIVVFVGIVIFLALF
jgi:hypothetical protein